MTFVGCADGNLDTGSAGGEETETGSPTTSGPSTEGTVADESGTGTQSTGATTEADSGTAGDPFEALDQTLDDIRSEFGVPGMAVALVAGDETIYSAGFGVRELGGDEPVDAATPFRIASVSKTVVGVALMRAVELGLIGLDEPVAGSFAVDNPYLEGEQITYRHLAGHTSGIQDSDTYECSYFLEADEAYLDPQVAAMCPPAPLTDLDDFLAEYLTEGGQLYDPTNFAMGALAEPGDQYRYSNISAALAAAALERVIQDTGRDPEATFEGFTQAQVFEPLGMSNTAWHRVDLPNPAGASASHELIDGELAVLPPYELATFPDGNLYSSADDMARYLATIVGGAGAYEGGQVLEASSVEQMLMPAAVRDDSVEGQGIFWEHFFGLVGHTGGDPGVATAMAYDVEAGFGFVILLNGSNDAAIFAIFNALSEFAVSYG